MSDHQSAPDPMDKAYGQAETILTDEAARAARRARVLAAVAREQAAPRPPVFPATRRPAWRRGGWLAAACVAGLSVVVANQIYQPFTRGGRTPPPRAARPTPTVAVIAAPAKPSAPMLSQAPTPPTPAPVQVRSAPPPSSPAPPSTRAPKAFPAAAAPNEIAQSLVGAGDHAAEAQNSVGLMAAAPPPPELVVKSRSSAARPTDPAARLRAAAASDRIVELEALLAQGVPVDAPDADGETALMKSIQSGHPAAARLLRRHGASLDRKNNAGQSARDMAAAKDDPQINQALGVEPGAASPP